MHESREREFFRAVEHPEYERVCKGCGTHWDVPSAFVHSAADVSAAGSALDPHGEAETVEEFDSDIRLNSTQTFGHMTPVRVAARTRHLPSTTCLKRPASRTSWRTRRTSASSGGQNRQLRESGHEPGPRQALDRRQAL